LNALNVSADITQYNFLTHLNKIDSQCDPIAAQAFFSLFPITTADQISKTNIKIADKCTYINRYVSPDEAKKI
jgi:hypothetical protein